MGNNKGKLTAKNLLLKHHRKEREAGNRSKSGADEANLHLGGSAAVGARDGGRCPW